MLIGLTPVVSAKTLKCDQNITYNDQGIDGPHPDHVGETTYWMGSITGDLSGTIYFWELVPDPYVAGNVMRFQDFYIEFNDGWVSGYYKGLWNFATFKYRATGRVTDASANYEYLIGSKFHEVGVTTIPEPPTTGTGTCFIGP